MTTRMQDFEILLAEDNPGDALLVREALKQYQVDCTVHVVSDGEQAIDFISSLESCASAPRLDLLLLDMHLPKRDGEDILRHLRSTERYAQTPVIVITGSDSSLFEETAIRNAALSYFRKTQDLAEFMRLGAVIRDMLGTLNNSEGRTPRACLERAAGEP